MVALRGGLLSDQVRRQWVMEIGGPHRARTVASEAGLNHEICERGAALDRKLDPVGKAAAFGIAQPHIFSFLGNRIPILTLNKSIFAASELGSDPSRGQSLVLGDEGNFPKTQYRVFLAFAVQWLGL